LPNDALRRYFVSIENPRLTLNAVVRGMQNNRGCQTDQIVRRRYSRKIFSLLRQIANAIKQLHSQGFVHGNVSLESCAKFDEKWKLANILGVKQFGDTIHYNPESFSVPPEAIRLSRQRREFAAQPSVDIWAFGSVSYEALVGVPLIPLDEHNNFDDGSFEVLLKWDSTDIVEVQQELRSVGIVEHGIDLISRCLAPDEDTRLTIDEILKHSFWSI
jgi:serine/threonine protein kinase